MKELYPAIQPYSSLRIGVKGGHKLYVEQVGNPDGLPILFLHKLILIL